MAKDRVRLQALVGVCTLLIGWSAAAQEAQVKVLSGRADMVTGGDALVQILGTPEKPLANITVTLNGRDVTSMFHPDLAAQVTGLVTGLKIGENVLEVFSGLDAGRTRIARATLTNYSAGGPVFAGPQQQPFICQTEAFKLPDGRPLGPALDSQCSVKTVVTYMYKSTDAAPATNGGRDGRAAFKPLPGGGALPPDVAWTTTTTGTKVPYVVRVETGTVNRSIYQFAVLHDPTAEKEPGPLVRPRGWNGRLLYSFGGGCPGGWFRQGTTLGAGGVINDEVVGKGYAEAGATLNVAGNSCNDTLSAETMMMVKERFIEAYGPPVFTFGRGGSGGSYQQNQIADRYPGLLDGIIPSANYPDVQALTQMLTDSQLLERYYKGKGSALTTEQKRAIAGVVQVENVYNASPLASRINPSVFCPDVLPAPQRYDPVRNRSGARCDVYDHNANQYGRDPATGFARRPIDNTGAQYGLAALNDGIISVAQFLDLNEHIGGYDVDGNMVATRSVADPLGLRNAYRHGLITYGRGLGQIPIIDVRGYRDLTPKGEHHLYYHSFSYRERIRLANGSFDNQVLLVSQQADSSKVSQYALEKMDEWLTALSKDRSGDPLMTRIARAKPSDLKDSCWTTGGGERVVEPLAFGGGGKCGELFPVAGGPRMVAGGPLANNVLKCQLKPIDLRDYKVTFTAAEQARLAAIFPDGVCDWSKPGVEQQAPVGRWQRF